MISCKTLIVRTFATLVLHQVYCSYHDFKPCKPLTSVTDVSPGGVEVSIVGRDVWHGDAQYALDEAMIIIDRLGEKFGIPYCEGYGPHCKSDQAAIPQMRFGAMEQWGLVTYRFST